MSIADEVPFDIPDSWEWVRLIDVCEYIQRGKSPKYSSIERIPVIAQKCNQWSGFSIEKAQFIDPDTLPGYGEERYLQDDDLMWNSTGLGTLGRIAIYKTSLNPYGIAVADSHVTVIRPFKLLVLAEYLYFYFANPSVQLVIEDQADGTTKQKELSTSTIKTYLVPLPPYEEQIRIIEKLHEVLPLLQQYGIVELACSQLNREFPDQLRKSILQLAVQGKLVPQDPSDEPASVLLERIREEKENLISAGKIKRNKHESVIYRRDNSHYEKRDDEERCIDEEIPFDIPASWEWVRLSFIADLSLGKMLDKAKNRGILQPYLRNANVRWGSFDFADILQMRFTEDEDARYSVQLGDVVMCEGGEPGRCAVWDCDSQFKIQKALHRIRPFCGIDGHYLFLLFSLYAKNGYFPVFFTGTTMI